MVSHGFPMVYQRDLSKVDHHYVGGYYGAASEEEMKRELVPLSRHVVTGTEDWDWTIGISQ